MDIDYGRRQCNNWADSAAVRDLSERIQKRPKRSLRIMNNQNAFITGSK